MAFVQDHGRSHFFTQRGMRAAKCDCGRDCGMSQQNLIHFVRRNVLASADDDVFDPPGQMQIAICVEITLIAGAKPSIHESRALASGLFSYPRNTFAP